MRIWGPLKLAKSTFGVDGPFMAQLIQLIRGLILLIILPLVLIDALPAFSEDFTQEIRIESTQFGKNIVQQLRTPDEESNTTSQRKEHKSVISSESLNEILSHLGILDGKGHPVAVSDGSILQFKKRDSQKRKGFLNGTFTIYGKAAVFANDGNLKTKIRLRARIYLDVSKGFTSSSRSEEMKDWVYLEIKIKNPTPQEKGGSNKYRMKVYDADALKLLFADPHGPSFDEVLSGVKTSALSLDNDPAKVDQFLDVIKKISQLTVKGINIGRDFIKPLEITSYIRESYSFKEAEYPVPAEVVKVQNKVVKFVQSKIMQKRPKIQNESKEIEYQITIDRRVRGFLPKMTSSDEFIDISRYADSNAGERAATYPENSVAIEFKEPVVVATLPFHFKSPIHQFLTTELTHKMIKSILPGYPVDRGKAGNLSRGLNRWVAPQL
jgi:hypothetical protein